MALFGGCQKDGGSKGVHRVRGDINVLLLGMFSPSFPVPILPYVCRLFLTLNDSMVRLCR
jgi:hypothetical protein